MKTNIQKIKERDSAALQALFQEVNPYLVKFLGAQKLSRPQIEEVIQASWATFFENIDSYEGRSQIKVFVAGIALNKMREMRRSEKKYIPEEETELMLSASFTPDGWWKTPPLNPDQILNSKEIGAAIEECLEGLSLSQRQAFLLKEVEDEPTEEICQVLNISISNLGVLIFRAKEKLRLCLQGQKVTI